MSKFTHLLEEATTISFKHTDNLGNDFYEIGRAHV